MKELDNLHNGVISVRKKIRKVDAPEKRLFYEIKAFSKQVMVFVAISEAGKTFGLLNRIQT